MNQDDLEKYLLSFDSAWRDDSMDETVIAYKFGESGDPSSKLFAVIDKNSKPLRVSLRCDPLLAKELREKFETVVSAKNLNRREWNTVICTGQLPDEEIFGLVRLSYRFATGELK